MRALLGSCLVIFILATSYAHSYDLDALARRYGAYVKMPSMGFSLFSPDEDVVVGYLVLAPAWEAVTEDKAQYHLDRIVHIQNALIKYVNAYLSLFWRPDQPLNGEALIFVVKESIKSIMGSDLRKVYVHDITANKAGKNPTL